MLDLFVTAASAAAAGGSAAVHAAAAHVAAAHTAVAAAHTAAAATAAAHGAATAGAATAGAASAGAAATGAAASSNSAAAAEMAKLVAQQAAAYKAYLAHQAAAHPFLTFCKNTALGQWVRNSAWAFPALQSAHFIGMTMLIGVVGAIDLRVLGVARAIPLAPLHRYLPLAFIGFGINLCTGIAFFCHDPYVYAPNTSFRIKMLLILLAGLNALWFRLGVFLDLEHWGPGIEASRLAKVISAVSILIWLCVITAGRYIAFT